MLHCIFRYCVIKNQIIVIFHSKTKGNLPLIESKDYWYGTLSPDYTKSLNPKRR